MLTYPYLTLYCTHMHHIAVLLVGLHHCMHYVAKPLAAACTMSPYPLQLHAPYFHAPYGCMHHIATPLMAVYTVLPCLLWLHAPHYHACIGLPSTYTFSFFFFLLTPSYSPVTMLLLLSLLTDAWLSSLSRAYHNATTNCNDNNQNCDDNIIWHNNSNTPHTA